MIREIVKIDEALCNGCGDCVPGCHEGALQIIDGKARLISELMCDGLGACIGHCPEGAITIEKREAEAYNETLVIAQMVKSGKNTVFAHLQHLREHGETGYLQEALTWIRNNQDSIPFTIAEVHAFMHGDAKKPAAVAGGGCPGSAPQTFAAGGMSMASARPAAAADSKLAQWPVQLHLINPGAGYFAGADLLIAADCAAFAHGDFHNTFIQNKKIVIACPKLDQSTETYVQKFIRLIDEAKVNTITVVIMEVPCCGGLIHMVQMARKAAHRNVPVKSVVVSVRGEVLSDEWV